MEMDGGWFQLDRRLPELATEEKVIEEPVLICDTHEPPQLMPAEALIILPREEAPRESAGLVVTPIPKMKFEIDNWLSAVALGRSTLWPRARLLFPVVTLRPAYEPMKVLMPPVVLASPAKEPWKLLLEPVVLESPAEEPKKLLLEPVVLARPAKEPKKLFSEPVVFASPAEEPWKLLSLPVVLEKPAELPRKLLLKPVVFDVPAELPKKLLSEPVVILSPAVRPTAKLFSVVVPNRISEVSWPLESPMTMVGSLLLKWERERVA